MPHPSAAAHASRREVSKPMTRARSQTSTVNTSDGRAVISVNGRVYRVDATDAVSVQVVSDNAGTYVQITDKFGKTRRADIKEPE